MNISAALALATERLQQAGIADARREAASLIGFALEKDASYLIAHPEHDLTEVQTAFFRDIVARRGSHEPFQYITGRQEFWRLQFDVTPDVLIPRPETEILVEEAIGLLLPIEHPRFCEVGTGSGCIAVSVLHTVRTATAVATDISAAALDVAKRNAKKHGVDGRLEFRLTSVFGGIRERFDLIVSNPPYVPDSQIGALQAEVRDFEPIAALSGGADGLGIVRRIVDEAPRHLKPGCRLLIEIGFDQADRVRNLFEPQIWSAIDLLPDLQGIPRIARARLK